MAGTPIDRLRYGQNNNSNMNGGDGNMNSFHTSDGFGDDIMQKMSSKNDSSNDIDDYMDEETMKKMQRMKKLKKKTNKNSDKIMKRYVPDIFQEPLIIAVLFIILSLNVVRKTLGAYIPQANLNEDGSIAFTGIVVYAIILSIGYLVLKKLLL